MVHAPRFAALCCGLLALCSVTALTARADNVTTSGTFTGDNEVLQLPFTTTTTQSYTFYTTSYSGGMNADGSSTAAGGFDPVLSLFNADGTLFSGDAVSNVGSDAFLTDVLGPGSYTLALSEFPNFSSDATLSGFAGIGTIVSDACGTSAAFTDAVDCSQRSGAYTVNYTSNAVTPEPPSALLLLLPLGGVVVLNRRRLLASRSL